MSCLIPSIHDLGGGALRPLRGETQSRTFLTNFEPGNLDFFPATYLFPRFKPLPSSPKESPFAFFHAHTSLPDAPVRSLEGSGAGRSAPIDSSRLWRRALKSGQLRVSGGICGCGERRRGGQAAHARCPCSAARLRGARCGRRGLGGQRTPEPSGRKRVPSALKASKLAEAPRMGHWSVMWAGGPPVRRGELSARCITG